MKQLKSKQEREKFEILSTRSLGNYCCGVISSTWVVLQKIGAHKESPYVQEPTLITELERWWSKLTDWQAYYCLRALSY